MSDQTYRIERCEHDIDKHPNAIVMGGHFVGRLEEHLPNCDGSRLVMVECMEAELVVDDRLQQIADAYAEHQEAIKSGTNTEHMATFHAVVALLSELVEGTDDDS